MALSLPQSSRRRGDADAPIGPETETARQIRETYEQVRMLVGKDIELMQQQHRRITDVLVAISASQERIVEVQAKTLAILEKIERRTDVEHAIRMRQHAHT